MRYLDAFVLHENFAKGGCFDWSNVISLELSCLCFFFWLVMEMLQNTVEYVSRFIKLEELAHMVETQTPII